MPNKFYVVWVGRIPGIYLSWDACKTQIHMYPDAKYKSFKTIEEATAMFVKQEAKIRKTKNTPVVKSVRPERFICVDGAHSSSTGIMEYRAFRMPDKTLLFHSVYPVGTNNVAEFLGLVEALKWAKDTGANLDIYTDSVTAMSWVRNREVKTTLNDSGMLRLIDEAIQWLKANDNLRMKKWPTKEFGEIPADFGNKH